MNKTFLLIAALLAPCAFAVDGVVLINQSTVMAAGGFPYVISQPGSYKLSGNLTMNTTQIGNYVGNCGGLPSPCDLAVGIGTSNVSLDLNGFTITVVNNIANLPHFFMAISEVAAVTGTAISNGHILLSGAGSASNVAPAGGFDGINLPTSTFNLIENVSVIGGPSSSTGALSAGLRAGKDSVVRRFITDDSSGFPICPSVVVESIGLSPGAGCATLAVVTTP